MRSPAACSADTADSRPWPGPRTRTSTSCIPNLRALDAACSAARVAANGVLLRVPLKPAVPAEAQHRTSPFMSVMVTMVLLYVAPMCAIPLATFRRCFRFPVFAIHIPQRVLTLLVRSAFRNPKTRNGLKPGLAPQFLNAFLSRHGLPRALSRPRVRPRSLAAHREAATMPVSAIAADVAQ